MNKIVSHSKIRSGKFKKRNILEKNLPIEAKAIALKIAPWIELYKENKISAPHLTASIILEYLKFRRPHDWKGSLLSTSQTLPHDSLIEWQFLFGTRSLRSVPLPVNRALLSWEQGHYPLELMFKIPSPKQVLNLQKNGKRCVTVFFKESEIDHYILGERDSLGFILHDLIHADHFFHHNLMMKGQIGFYSQMSELIESKIIDELLKDSDYTGSFEYLISDMNAHPVHLWKGLKSITEKKDEKTFKEIMIFFKSYETALSHLNRVSMNDSLALEITNWCENYCFDSEKKN